MKSTTPMGLRAFSQTSHSLMPDLHMSREEIDNITAYILLPRDANNLLAMLWTWQHGDISANPIYGGNFEKALAAITGKAIVMPGKTGLYFPPEDNEYEVSHMPNAECRAIPSIWGHIAGGPGLNPDDVKFIDSALKKMLQT